MKLNHNDKSTTLIQAFYTQLRSPIELIFWCWWAQWVLLKMF